MYVLRKILNVLKLIIIAVVILLIILMAKFKPMYKVTINGELIGYIADKNEVDNLIDKNIYHKNGCVAFADVNVTPEYEFALVERNVYDSTNELLQIIEDNSVITYRLFEIFVDNESKQYVASIGEAQDVVNEIKEEFEGKYDISIGVQEIFTQSLDNIESLDKSYAVANLDAQIVENADNTVDGIVLSKPVYGTVTSRFGLRWGRSHTGLDIAAPSGTDIHAASKGTVSFAGWNSRGYGYLVIIDHGNGIQTYYAHCSRIYVSVGDEVTKDTVIAAVGSTGNSTGPHLHFELRKNGTLIDPQNYLYK